ncbi:MAG TPA: HEAT repeat domain-containing protein [Spirochaetales bacterium]|nr:HEAT repeat domain-containing protein [Spirochaetales bacterium]
MRKALLIFFIAIPVFFSQSQNQVVDSPLTGALKKIFPALSRGYIDLNQNGGIDQNEDIDEVIAESTIKDGLIQGKEILDFIIKNYEFIPLEKLINTMTMAYQKEAGKSETEFVQARDELFTMIERGYPLPETLNQEDSQLIVNIMIHTIIKEAEQNSDQVKASIKTLGWIGDPTAVDYLLELLARPELKKESIKALGEIGSRKSPGRGRAQTAGKERNRDYQCAH